MKRLLLAFSLLLLAIPAHAFTISEDRGGQIGQYMQHYDTLRMAGEHVVVDGDCLSACTLIFGMLPKSQWCATSDARFGFHAAWSPDENGKPKPSVVGTDALKEVYRGDKKIWGWINKNGGLTKRLILLQGPAIFSYAPRCGAENSYAEVPATKHPVHRHRWYRQH